MGRMEYFLIINKRVQPSIGDKRCVHNVSCSRFCVMNGKPLWIFRSFLGPRWSEGGPLHSRPSMYYDKLWYRYKYISKCKEKVTVQQPTALAVLSSLVLSRFTSMHFFWISRHQIVHFFFGSIQKSIPAVATSLNLLFQTYNPKPNL